MMKHKMPNSSITEFIANSDGFKANYPLNHLTWFKVGGPAEFLFKPKNELELAEFVAENHKQSEGQLALTVIGAGSNIIVRDGGIKGVVVKLGQGFTDIELTGDQLIVGAGCLNFNLAKFCLANNISGFEFLIGIPGTIGGGVVMNAGSYGSEFKDIVLAATCIDKQGNIITLLNEEIGFKHRSSNLPPELIVTKVIFKIVKNSQEYIMHKMNEITAKRSATQPIKERTGGSTFVNPLNCKAWELIDKAGFRGYRHKGAFMSDLHCNFMINAGEASASDLEELGEIIKEGVFKQSGVMLEWEIKRLGEKIKEKN